MNIFFLSKDPIEAASMMCDKHVVKMILESAQMLSTAHRILDGDENVNPIFYKATHKNHPCAKWVREGDKNYNWLRMHMEGLGLEYFWRYDKVHKTIKNLQFPLQVLPKNIPKLEAMTPPPLAMPDEYKSDDLVESYRSYYIGAKNKIAKWKHGNVPDWWRETC